ncbi:MAG TPA: 30S ribosomal protein S15 [Thermoplasmata archaeon]|nr:30S ribosomal protein S15 [Thermoplasmata archaeon]
MARLHAKRKGKSGSTKPFLKANPEWVPLEAKEIEDTILRMHAEGFTAAAIGVRLRDSHGVPNVRLATGKGIMDILKARGVKIDIPQDLSSLMKRAVEVQSHLKRHAKDLSNKRGMQLIESKIRRLSRYYKEQGVLPQDWDYSLKLAELQVK